VPPAFQAIPILRIFDLEKARDFYVGFLGFRVDWEHRFEYHREITAKGYRFMRPGVEVAPWNARVMEVIDPFGNRLRFNEPIGPAPR
jgi:catechol 2,3-dioxygenase-like lactoylglutathione lyase family enzyme